jgi:hypothetical protein
MSSPLLVTVVMLMGGVIPAQEPREGVFVHLGVVHDPGVNSLGVEYAPELSADGLELYFGSNRGGQDDLYVARRSVDGSPWEVSEPLSELNSGAREAAPSISADCRELYFVSERRGRREIFVATRDTCTGRFADPRPLEIGVPGWVPQGPEISSDGRELFFHARDNGSSAKIWVAWRDEPEEAFGAVRPLDELRTGCNEIQPSISRDGRTLFWSDDSCGRIWTATRPGIRDESSEPIPFEDPRPLGLPIGGLAPSVASAWPSPGAEFYFSLNDQIHRAIWRSDCNGNGVDDMVDITAGTSTDGDGNDVPDECDGVVSPAFRRGAVRGEERLDISDGIRVLGYLFLGSDEPPCLDAADADDSGTLDVTDGIRVLNYLFLGGAVLPDPGPTTCGEDPTPDTLGCATPTRGCPH